jgi:hypothetical protein
MFGYTSTGSWWLTSKKDPRWNTHGNSSFVGGFEMCDEAKEKLEVLKLKYGKPPKDLTHGYMKD